ncbi:MAG: hypothetical protein IPM78_13230 [Moraxellaceae bacterium]|nr:hypothetical protein [Moraxellaceae bacterium]
MIPVSDQWYDAKTNLIWQRCCMGQHWQNGQVVGKEKLFNESEKQELLEQFKDSGWRLPIKSEQRFVLLRKVGYITKMV